MNLNDLLAALSPKRQAMEIQGFKFYARPMSVREFNEHIQNNNKEDRDEKTILRCVEDESGKPVFKNIEQVRGLYTTVKAQLIGLVALASMMPEPSKVEQEVK
ncbi:cytochrome [Providencia sp. JUb39]|uniref:cytochrome n=1 Tax=Providencia sp. JUb39 TaxID=2724165 RepID=UPI00164E8185|nr:cytochrome [Providencia sp. JUb39]MBC5790608.1 cytochrome [Providencia sp. JUb39]